MFAIAQIMYISAFGFKPLNLILGSVLYTSCSIGKIIVNVFKYSFSLIAICNRCLMVMINVLFSVIYALMPGLNGILAIGVPIYTVLLTTMAWRAISRVQFFGVNLCNNIKIIEMIFDFISVTRLCFIPFKYATLIFLTSNSFKLFI